LDWEFPDEYKIVKIRLIGLQEMGYLIVTAKVGDSSDSCTVTVNERSTPMPVNPDEPEPPPVESDEPVESDGGLLEILEGDLVMELTSTGFVSANRASEWTVSDDTVCSVLPDEGGLRCALTALKAGTCTLTATCGEESASCMITVKESGAPADVPSVSGGSPAMEFYLELAPGGSKIIDVPSEYLSLLSMAQWSSSDPSVCTVAADSEAGTVVAVAHKAGKCDLTASLGFYSAVCHVTVGRSQ
jgi:hypothetical protein